MWDQARASHIRPIALSPVLCELRSRWGHKLRAQAPGLPSVSPRPDKAGGGRGVGWPSDSGGRGAGPLCSSDSSRAHTGLGEGREGRGRGVLDRGHSSCGGQAKTV